MRLIGYEAVAKAQADNKFMRQKAIDERRENIGITERKAAERQAEQARIAASQQMDAANRMGGMYQNLLSGIGGTSLQSWDGAPIIGDSAASNLPYLNPQTDTTLSNLNPWEKKANAVSSLAPFSRRGEMATNLNNLNPWGERSKAATNLSNLNPWGNLNIKNDIATGTAAARADLAPWRKAGTDALGQLQEKISAGPGDLRKSLGYQFRLAEGQKAIERGAAARGGALSGAAIKAGLRYGQDFATNEYDNFLRRYYESMQPLERMSGQGMKAAGIMSDISRSGRDQMAAAQLQTARDIGAFNLNRASQEENIRTQIARDMGAFNLNRASLEDDARLRTDALNLNRASSEDDIRLREARDIGAFNLNRVNQMEDTRLRAGALNLSIANQMDDTRLRANALNLSRINQANTSQLQKERQEASMRLNATQGMAGAAQYGGESLAGGTMNAANVMAAQNASQIQRDVAYNAWKQGGLEADKAKGFWGYIGERV